MSLARKAVQGAAWTITASIGARIIGALGTVIITRFLAPEVIGEVAAATILVYTANTFSNMGFGNYIVVKGDQGRDVPFHATFFMVIFGVIGLGTILVLGPRLGPVLDAPGLAAFLPGMVLAVALRRLASIPDKILIRDMRFRAVAVANGLGEILYTVSAVALAATTSLGGHAIVIGNILQSALLLAVLIGAAGIREWLTPCRITWQRTRDIFQFGIPMGIMSTMGYAQRYWDNLVFSRYFGAADMGLYNLAYNLADIPATQVGEHIGAVLLPSMGKLAPERRGPALVRSTALLALLIFPMAIGLGSVAESLIAVILNEEWQGVAPLLTVLASVSVFRPIGWSLGAYLLSYSRTQLMMWMGIVDIIFLLGGVVALAPLGPVWACVGVGVGFGLSAIMGIVVVSLKNGPRLRDFLPGFVGPLLACGPMVAAVLGTRVGFDALGVESDLISLLGEIIAGAVLYVPSALVLAPRTSRDFLGLVKSSIFAREKTE